MAVDVLERGVRVLVQNTMLNPSLTILISNPQIQLNKQFLGTQRVKLFDLGDFRLTENAARNNSRWTSEEQLLAVQGRSNSILLL